MIEDRRKHPRYSVLTRCVLNWSGGRRELLCTEVGPASAFLHTRPDGFEVGGAASLEMRAGGLGSPMTKLTCRIARVVPGGGPGPSGLAVVWQTAACDLGLDALVRFLTTVLRLPQVSAAEVTLGGHAEFDIAGYHAGVGRVTVGSGRGGEPDVVGLAARAHSSGRHSALNATVAGLAATTSTGPRPTVPNPLQDDIRSQRSSVSGTHPAVGPTSRTGVSGTYPSVAPTSRSSGNIPSITAARPTPTPSELPEWRRPSSQGPAPRLDQPVLTTGRVSQQAIKMVLAVASEALDGPPPQLSQPTPGLQPPAVPVQGIEPLRRSSQSRMRMEEIPVAAVRPATGSHVQLVLPPVDKGRPPVGERTPGLGWKPPTFSPKSSSDPFGFAEMTATPPAAPPVATLPSAEEGTQQSWPVYALGAGERRSPTDAVGWPKVRRRKVPHLRSRCRPPHRDHRSGVTTGRSWCASITPWPMSVVSGSFAAAPCRSDRKP